MRDVVILPWRLAGFAKTVSSELGGVARIIFSAIVQLKSIKAVLVQDLV
jgi:hypothetical protein